MRPIDIYHLKGAQSQIEDKFRKINNKNIYWQSKFQKGPREFDLACFIEGEKLHAVVIGIFSLDESTKVNIDKYDIPIYLESAEMRNETSKLLESVITIFEEYDEGFIKVLRSLAKKAKNENENENENKEYEKNIPDGRFYELVSVHQGINRYEMTQEQRDYFEYIYTMIKIFYEYAVFWKVHATIPNCILFGLWSKLFLRHNFLKLQESASTKFPRLSETIKRIDKDVNDHLAWKDGEPSVVELKGFLLNPIVVTLLQSLPGDIPQDASKWWNRNFQHGWDTSKLGDIYHRLNLFHKTNEKWFADFVFLNMSSSIFLDLFQSDLQSQRKEPFFKMFMHVQNLEDPYRKLCDDISREIDKQKEAVSTVRLLRDLNYISWSVDCDFKRAHFALENIHLKPTKVESYMDTGDTPLYHQKSDKSRQCAHPGCGRYLIRRNLCAKHAGLILCRVKNCQKYVEQGEGVCSKHRDAPTSMYKREYKNNPETSQEDSAKRHCLIRSDPDKPEASIITSVNKTARMELSH